MAAAHDQLAAIRRNQQALDSRQMEQFGENLAVAPDGPMAPFSTSNDAALAAHLQEQREKNVEYLRLQTEETRQQFINTAADNFRRSQEAKQEITNRGQIERQQVWAQDAAEAERVQSELAALASDPDVANKNPWTTPLEKLRSTAQTLQKAERLQSLYPNQQQPQTRAETFPDGSLYQLKNLPDGQMEVQLVTGERFTGDPITVTQKMAEAQVNTKLWARHKVAEAQQSPQQTAQPTQLNQQPTEQNTLAEYWADQQAKSLGFSDKAEMISWGEKMTAFQQQYEDERLATQFIARCPDFPGTAAANDAVIEIVRANGWQYTPENLEAAHLLAVQRHAYQPLSAEQIQAANGNIQKISRPTAPPMLRGNNPEHVNIQDPYNMPLADLRKQAIAQALGGGINRR